MNDTSGITLLTVEGPARARGQHHGEALRALIQDAIGQWKTLLGDATGMDPDAYLAGFLKDTDFPSAMQRWTPELLAEIRGISEGSGVDYDTILAYQLVDEEWWYRRGAMESGAHHEGESCSGLGVFNQGEGPPLAAQNMDVPSYYDGYQTLLHVKEPESDVEALVFTVAGLIGLNGLNSKAVSICCNTLMQLDHAGDGLPVACIVRGVLARPSQADAVAFVQRVSHASGQNYIIGGPQEVLDFECSANKVSRFVPRPGVSRVYHTNHPLVNDDQGMFKGALKTLSPERMAQVETSIADTRGRYDYLERELSDAQETITVERIKAILSSHEAPVCRDRIEGRGLTLGCTIMELASAPALHLAPGPPCSTPFTRYTF